MTTELPTEQFLYVESSIKNVEAWVQDHLDRPEYGACEAVVRDLNNMMDNLLRLNAVVQARQNQQLADLMRTVFKRWLKVAQTQYVIADEFKKKGYYVDGIGRLQQGMVIADAAQIPPNALLAWKQLDDMAKLQPNWDGYGAPSIRPDLIDAAKRLIAALPSDFANRPLVVPMSTGNLQFEWHKGPKILELEFETPSQIHFLQWHPTAHVEEEGLVPAEDVGRVAELIQWFTSEATSA